MSEMQPPPLDPPAKIRRVVTGHNDTGQSCILSDSACGVSVTLGHPDLIVTDAWHEKELPADNGRFVDICTKVELEPARAGNIFRIVRFPPDSQYLATIDPSKEFDRLGETGSASHHRSTRHPLMHRSNTLDYVVILSGEIYVVMDEGEALLRPGDVLIQRGTNHAWSNRSTDICVLAVVLNGADSLMADSP